MAKLIRCECGFVARGDNDDQVIGVIRGHMATDHPVLLDTVSREDLLGWIRVEVVHYHISVLIGGLVFAAAALVVLRTIPGPAVRR